MLLVHHFEIEALGNLPCTTPTEQFEIF